MFRLDDRYLLLIERDVRWLDRAYDGWDLESDRPVTAAFFPTSDPPPLFPGALRLRHPAIVPMLDLRQDEDGGVWVVWEHFGRAGADRLDEAPAPLASVLWLAHEATRALVFARESGNRAGGFRMADFGPDQIRIYADGTVRVVGFGRLSAESDGAAEFARLGDWAAAWLAHSSDPGTTSGVAELPGPALAALSAFAEADANPHAGAARILAGFDSSRADGPRELSAWAGQAAPSDPVQELEQMAKQSTLAGHAGAELIGTAPFAPPGSDDAESGLPPLAIAPAERKPVQPRAKGFYKGLPRPPRNLFPYLILGLLVLLVLMGGWRFRWLSSLFGWAGEPQVKIESAPPGAGAIIDGEQLAGTTPLALNDLAVGWHHIKLSAREFPPLVDSFLVYKSGPHRPYRFVFTRPLRIESRPPGAVVYQNGERAPNLTPFVENDWPVSDHLTLVMHLESYGSIEDCVLDPAYGTVEVKDPAAWTTERRGDTVVVVGVFARTVAFLASPPDSRVTLDDTLVVDGTAGRDYVLTFGEHALRAEAVGFGVLDTTIVVSGQSPEQIPVVLTRPVRLVAVDPRWPDRDLRALIDRLDGPERTLFVRRFTPYSVRLPAVAFTALLRKRGYRDTTIYIPPDVTRLEVAMVPGSGSTAASPGLPIARTEPPEPSEPSETAAEAVLPADWAKGPWITIQISVPVRRPLEGAEIWSRSGEDAREIFLGRTNRDGQLRVRMASGNYDLLAYLDAYSGVRKRVKVRPARNRPIEIELNP